jgi:Uma2 family endonuclease
MRPITNILVPQRQKMSYTDYLESASETRIVEWTKGEMISYMPPIPEHQDIALFMAKLLSEYVDFLKLGTVMVAPLEVNLWPNGPSREPDVIFLSKNKFHQIKDKNIEGAPNLLIEIISPTSVRTDRVDKMTEYEQAGVAEYWIIDPRPRQQQADFYTLGANGLYQPAPIEPSGRYYSTVLPDFWLNIDWLWQRPLPMTQLCFIEIILTHPTLSPEMKAAYQTLYELLTRR